MDKKIIIKYFIIIAIFLAVVFVSQQPYGKGIINNFLSYVEQYGGAWLTGGLRKFAPENENKNETNTDYFVEISAKKPSTESTAEIGSSKAWNKTGSGYSSADLGTIEQEKWTFSKLPEKIIENIKSGGEAMAGTINNTKEKISETISDAQKNIQNYFSNIGNAIINNGSQESCKTPEPALNLPNP